jgi:hypothetical protein
MNDFKNSVTILLFYTLLVLGIAQVQYIEENLLDFDPLFFILFALAILSELFFVSNLLKLGVRVSLYLFLGFWAAAYLSVWVSYWRVQEPLSLQILFLQFILVEVAAALAYTVGRNIGQLEKTLDGLSITTYPNRAMEIDAAADRIDVELTRSRRYHNSLPILVLRLESASTRETSRSYEPLQRDMLVRFTNAKLGQIISELSRQTDLILRDRNGQFVILCPETDYKNLSVLVERIRAEVSVRLGSTIVWGAAAFPDDALNFEDLLEVAESKLTPGGIFVEKTSLEIPDGQNSNN